MMEKCLKIIILGIIVCNFVSNTVQISREMFTNEPCGSDLFRCDNARCTQLSFRCDRDTSDCQDGSDERQCRSPLTELFGYHMFRQTREKAAEWLIQKVENYSATNDWEYAIARTAVALYLTNETYFAPGNSTGKMIASKLRLQMLDKLAQRNIDDLPVTELAVFLNAFLVSCINPRNFHGVDLVVELRVRTHSPSEYTNPYALLALCNAGENMTSGDIQKLRDVFNKAEREVWTDMQAYSMMALSCAAAQPHNTINMTTIANQFNTILPPQDANGTLDNVKTTSLILQAFIAASKFPSRPSRSWHPQKYFNADLALTELVRNLKSNDSMDKVQLMYYGLPVLSFKTLGNISFSHCNHHDSETDAPLEQKIQVIYSLWFGIDKYMEKTLRIRVPANANFQSAMDIASKLDYSYRYNSTVRNGKSYIYSISGTQDDPENDKFWSFYRITNNNLATQILNQNPLEYIPTDKEHLVLWFKKGPWAIEE